MIRRLPLVLLPLLLAAFACTSSSPPSSTPATNAPVPGATAVGAPRGGTLRIGVETIDSLDPADASPTRESDLIAADLLFDGLTAIDPATNQAVPTLAKALTPDQYALTWTIALRPDATFSDGSPVTAADAKFSLERLALKGASSLAGSRLEIVNGYADYLAGAADMSGLVVTDDHTLTITLKEPYAALPELLSSPLYGIVPQAAVTASKADFVAKPVGSGPFVHASTDDQTITVKRAPKSDARLDAVQLVRFEDRGAPLAALKDHKVDVATVPPGTVIDVAPDVGTVKPGKRSSELFFGFNYANAGVGEGKELYRKAIVKAVDRKRIAHDVLHARDAVDGVVPPGILPPGSGGCDDCAYDVAAAKALLVQAFPDGNVPPLRIAWYTGDSVEDKAQAQAAEAVVADLRAAGIPVETAVSPLAEYRTSVRAPEQQLFSFGWVGLAPDPDFYLGPLLASTSDDNVMHFSGGGMDFTLVKARATLDRAERMKTYGDIEKQAMALAPIVPLAVFDSSVVVAPGVSGYDSRPDGTFVTTTVGIAR